MIAPTATAARTESRGGCLCGAVRFVLQLPSRWCAHCHCSMCRRAHGAGYVTWVGVQRSQFSLLAGEDCLRWYDSSPGARRGFCQRCGSSMLFESARWPDETHVTLANIDDPIDRVPELHVYHEARVDWMPLDLSLRISGG